MNAELKIEKLNKKLNSSKLFRTTFTFEKMFVNIYINITQYVIDDFLILLNR